MEVLSFNISGKLAHFRKYYANNTAFSFTIPPRTTLMGIVAASMGWERDSYYEQLSSEHIRFGVRVLSPLKKSFHRLNFLSIKKLGDMSKKWSSDFRGEGGRIQTPFEVVSGHHLVKDQVSYQIFIASQPNCGKKAFEQIREHFLNHQPIFNISLGVAGFNASIGNVSLMREDDVTVCPLGDYVLVHSAIPSDHVDDLKFRKEGFGNYNFVEEDMMPGDFVSNDNREVRQMNRLLFSTTPNPLRVKLNQPPYKLRFPDKEIVIQFMDA